LKYKIKTENMNIDNNEGTSIDPVKFQVIQETLPSILPEEKGGLPTFKNSLLNPIVKQEIITDALDKIEENSVIMDIKLTNPTDAAIATSFSSIPARDIISESDTTSPPDSDHESYLLDRAEIEDSNELTQVSSAGKKYVWGMSHAGDLYHCKMGEIGLEWEKLKGGIRFADFSVAKGGVVFAIGKETGLLYRVQPEKNIVELAVEDTMLTLKSVSAVSWDSAYCLTDDDSLVHFDKDKFTMMTGKLKKISVAGPSGGGLLGLGSHKFELWGIDLEDFAVKFKPEHNIWERYPVKVQDVAAGKDLVVYAIRLDDLQLLKFDREKNEFIYQQLITNRTSARVNLQLKNITAYKENRDVYAVEANSGDIIKLYH
jgi:hypothetical protein